tara:strand:+ start:16 stop:567 length:552 start_codon:yes stop_codon:yes gene_type:complete
MVQILENLDTQLLLFINQTLANSLFDIIMPLLDDPKRWIPIILCIWIITLIKDPANRLKLLILLPLTILFCDQIGGLIKSLHLRDRPWFDLGTDIVRHLGKSTGRHLSFPSNHAFNISGVAFLFSNTYPRYKYYFWFLACTIMYSRIYIGVHYPIDVFFGCLFGILISFIIINTWEKLLSIKS